MSNLGFRFNLKSGVKTMNTEEYSRWLCLVEAINVINNHQEDIEFKGEVDIHPGAIQKYIDERFHAMHKDVAIEIALGNLPAEQI